MVKCNKLESKRWEKLAIIQFPPVITFIKLFHQNILFVSKLPPKIILHFQMKGINYEFSKRPHPSK